MPTCEVCSLDDPDHLVVCIFPDCESALHSYCASQSVVAGQWRCKEHVGATLRSFPSSSSLFTWGLFALPVPPLSLSPPRPFSLIFLFHSSPFLVYSSFAEFLLII